MSGLRRFLRGAWGLARPYWGSEEWRSAWLLVLVLVTMNVGLVYLNVLFTARIGWRLTLLNYDQQRYEADFRVALVRVRENAEGVALYRGEPGELRNFRQRFAEVMRNWWGIMGWQKRLLALAPDWLFLDEATSALGEAEERCLYMLLAEQLPRTAMISVGHRSTLRPFHARHWAVVSADLSTPRLEPAGSSLENGVELPVSVTVR